MLRFVTGNEGKVREAQSYLDQTVTQADYDYPEIQAPDPEPIAVAGAEAAHDALGGPVLVDDSGLFIDAFDGFPGPYSAYVEDTIGINRVAELAEQAGADTAAFRCVVAYATEESVTPPADGTLHRSGSRSVVTFEGRVSGRIVPPRGDGGFGYDPIFEYDGQTLAERSTDEKNDISHRGQALAKLAAWLNV